jgi:two-component system, sensor histidine kinase and response regulator
MKTTSAEAAKTIMIVDDEPNNLNVLEAMLREEGGYKVVAFTHGAAALDVAANEPPDLILLDIRMPGMDGFEVCRRLKASKKLAGIPVLFLSALTDPLDKVKGFELGALDYITKPLSEAEVLARVKTHLSLRAYQLDMEEQIRLRTEELVEAHRRLRIWDNAKSQWLEVLSHEMRTPLTGLFGIADFIFDELPEESSLHDFRPEYETSRARMLKLVDDSLLLTYVDVASNSFKVNSVQLDVAMKEALLSLERELPNVNVLFNLEKLTAISILAEPSLLFRACTDLLKTVALCVLPSERIFIESSIEEAQIHLHFRTNGQHLPPDSLATFFEVCGQRTLILPGGDIGLGAALAARIIELCNGSVSIKNGDKHGILIEVVLPCTQTSALEPAHIELVAEMV